MQLRRLCVALHPALVAILAVALLTGGSLASAAPAIPTAAGAPRVPAASSLFLLFHPTFLHNQSDHQSALYVQNPDAVSAATVQLTFYRATADPFILMATVQPGATLNYARGQVPGLPDGSYSLEIASDQPLASVVEIYRNTGDRLAAYRGMTASAAASAAGPSVPVYRLVFSPFFDSGGLTLWNISAQAAQAEIDLYQPDGSIHASFLFDLPAGGVYSFSGSEAHIAAGLYTAVVSSTEPLAGLLTVQTAGVPPPVFELQAPAAAPSTTASVPRAQKQVDEGGGPRTSQLFLTNVGSTDGHFSLTFYSANGNAVYTRIVSALRAFGTTALDLATFDSLPAGTYSVRASGDQPLMLSELTTYITPPATHSVATYGERSTVLGQSLTRPAATPQTPGVLFEYLPRLAKGADAYTVLSIGNPSVNSADAVIEYRDLAGNLLANEPFHLAPGGWARFDLREMTGLPAGFTGSAVIASTGPLDILADEFYVACVQPGGGQISRVPAGELFPGAPVKFTASAAGTQPFSYLWAVDGQPAGSDSATLDYTFQTAGQHAVGVTITNTCGQTTASLGVDVLEPPGPDLSTSSKTVSQSAAGAGDTLTYTLILRNTGPIAASAVLTDPIPLHTVYVPDSAQASNLAPVTFDGAALHWAGQVVSGTAVMIQYAVQIQPAPIGTSIENIASLSDGQGHITTLRATTVFSPGYRLTINEGALFTNNPTVALRFAWNAADGITAYQISNDGGFIPGSGTTAWLPVNPADPTYPDWMLATYGDLRLPRTVYIRFRDAGGTPFGPFQDDIILDPVPPQVDSLDLVPLGGTVAGFSSTSGISSTSGRSVLVRVIAHDDNSGVRTVQLSNRSDFAVSSSCPVTGSLTEIVWPLQPSGLVYGRVVDRAGNTSPAVSAQGKPWWYRVYLPVLQRNAQ